MTATMKRLVVLVLIFAMLSTAVPVVLADEGEGHNAFVSADEPTEPGGSYTLVSDPDDVHGSTEVVAYIETATFPTLSDFDLTDGTPVEAIPPTSLREGEIWAGKAVAYHDNGTATITLLAWGSTWGGDQMPLDEGNRYVTIIDNIGEFRVDEAALPLGVVAGPNNTVIWNVVETDIIEPEPAYVSFIVYLCEDEPREARWYATGFASVRFYPARGNPFYWTQEEVTHNAFEMSMNWNNGAGSGGLNEGTITDNILNIDIYFGTNHNSPENQRVADAIFPTHWNTTVGPEGQRLYWHLDWIRTNIAKTYIFTVRGLEANGVDIAYEIIFPRGGGNESHPGSRTLVSTEYFRRHFVSGNPDLPFTWDNGAIVYDLEVAAQIRLQSPPPIVLPVGTLQVNKVLAGEFEKDWDVGAETPFQAILKNQDGLYLTFQAGAEVNQYIYAGFVSERALATVITFSVAHPAVITEMPVYAAASTPPIRYFVEEIFEVETNLIQVSYSFDEDGFTIAGGEGRTQVTVTNTYQHGVGYFVVRKRLDGFAKDWGVNHDTVFYVRIWDVERENYLLFKDYPEPDGTFQRIGNHVFGLTEDYQGLPVMELPVSVNQPLHLSYLWTWGKYEVREVRRTTTNSIEKEWVAFWNHTDLDRDPTFQNRPDGVWTDGLWLRETWLGHWEYVDEITCIDTWHEDDDWVWGAAYSENNGVRELQFNETITVTVTNRYKYSSGNMTIAKELAGSPEDWGINERTLFHANIWAIRDPANPGDRVALIFEEMHQAHGDVVFRNIGYIDGAGVPEFYYPQDAGIDFLRRIPFSVTSPALVVGLPAYGGHYYFVEEFFEDGVVTDHITTSYILNGEPISADGVQIAAETNNSFVVHVRNDYDYGRSNLVIVKELDGFPGNWEVDEFTQFFAGVREEGTDTYLHFALQVDGSFLHIPAGAAYTGETVWIIPFSAANPVIITGLPITGLFVVDELCEEGNDIYNKFSTGFTVIVEHDRTNFAVGGNMIATVTNRFEHGTGTLIIEKELANAPPFITDGDWFFASVRDATDSTYLRFVLVDEETNTWRSVGNDLDWIAEHVKEEVYEEIRFSVNRPATLINLWSGRIYVINEGPGDYTSVHEPLRIMQNGDVLTSRIINEFPTFTVTYDGNGNTAGVPPVDAEEYPVGAEVTVLGPNDLAKDGYHFLGWNTAPDGTGDWHQPDDTFQMPAANVTLYAQWERDVEPPPTFTVTYDGNGNTAGVPPVDEEEYLADADVTVLGRNNLVKDGYHFLGWNTAPDGTGDWHQPDDTFQMPAANVTLYAQWERDVEPPPT
ncbi:MAG: InlB B-repeat-containing protein, partial [Oscillospiraceae bacterium]|nr:InlB B-repeat-containing protein [Oscillospiraceae bacterium]